MDAIPFGIVVARRRSRDVAMISSNNNNNSPNANANANASANGIRVGVISANPDTRSDLAKYLRNVGVEACCSPDLEDVASLAPSIVALIVFPDELPFESVVVAVTEIVNARPNVLPVLVTSEPKRYDDLLEETNATDDRQRVLVVPRPVWAWAIYDAIREQLATTTTTTTTTTTGAGTTEKE